MNCRSLVATFWLAVVAVGCGSEAVERRPLLEVSTDQLVTFDDGRLLYRIRDINTDDAGNIWALSRVEPFIYVYRGGSDSVVEFGQQGGDQASSERHGHSCAGNRMESWASGTRGDAASYTWPPALLGRLCCPPAPS